MAEIEERIEWERKREDYLQLRKAFELWDFHFWMDGETFDWYRRMYGDDYYLPCDSAERQCATTCTYFGEKCPRKDGEVEMPEILRRYKYEFDRDDEQG